MSISGNINITGVFIFTITRLRVGPLQECLRPTLGPGHRVRGGGKVPSGKKTRSAPGAVLPWLQWDRKDTGQLHAGKSSVRLGHEQPIRPPVGSHAALSLTPARQ